MATFAKRILSGSTDGLPINVSSTAGGGTTVHTGSTSTNTIDEIYLTAHNSATSIVTMYLEWGASASQVLVCDVPARGEGPVVIVAGLPLQGRSAAGTVIYAYASTSNVLNLYGHVNRITQ